LEEVEVEGENKVETEATVAGLIAVVRGVDLGAFLPILKGFLAV